jgi:hypothetical protein
VFSFSNSKKQNEIILDPQKVLPAVKKVTLPTSALERFNEENKTLNAQKNNINNSS